MNSLAMYDRSGDAEHMSVDEARRPIRVGTEDIDLQIARVQQRLTADFSEQLDDRSLVDACVRDARAAFTGARITQFIPTLVERRVRGRLREAARSA
jgi:hypothetical protein